MRVLGIIPARGGSKRLPRKNVRPLGGKPLVTWMIEAGLAARSLARLVVSSDDDEVLRIAAGYNDTLPLRRPEELAGDASPAIDYVHHALRMLEAQADEAAFDAVAILQPTSPFTEPRDIDACVGRLRETAADCAVTVMQIDHMLHPLKLKTLQGDRLMPYLEAEAGRMAAKDLPAAYVRNGSVYASRRRVLDAGTIITEDCRAVVMPRQRSIDINDDVDYRFAQFLLTSGLSAPQQAA